MYFKNFMMKKIISVLFLFAFLSIKGFACDIKFNIVGDKKASYKAGDELIVEVTVTYTHRVCELEIGDTKFSAEGVKILGAAPWKEVSPTKYTRQLKVAVLADSKKEAVINADRTCKKEGGHASFKITKE